MAHIVLQKRTIATTKSHFPCRRVFSNIHNLRQLNLNRKETNHSIYSTNVLASHWLRKRAKISIFGTTIKQHDLLSFQRRKLPASRLWSGLFFFRLQKISSNKWHKAPEKLLSQLATCSCPKLRKFWTINLSKSQLLPGDTQRVGDCVDKMGVVEDP